MISIFINASQINVDLRLKAFFVCICSLHDLFPSMIPRYVFHNEFCKCFYETIQADDEKIM